MIHRLALRVLPSLTLAVTTEEVRKRKRLVMLAPGLVAFAVYRIAKHVLPLSDPAVLLALSGVVSLVTAACCYAVGRKMSVLRILEEDGVQRLTWVLGWIGFVYGVQLSLLVLALLYVVHYDFLKHSDGPGMMAIIIACTAVARDAFEIGHVRWLERSGRPVPTFPDRTVFRLLFREFSSRSALWAVGGACIGAFLAAASTWIGPGGFVGPLIAVSLGAGSVAVGAYSAGRQPHGSWVGTLSQAGWSEVFRFWWWPGLAFASTYYLVLAGISIYVLRVESVSWLSQGLMGGLVGGMMGLYGYYLGSRRDVEDRVLQTVPNELLRCPFVMGILSKTRHLPEQTGLSPAEIALGDSGRRG